VVRAPVQAKGKVYERRIIADNSKKIAESDLWLPFLALAGDEEGIDDQEAVIGNELTDVLYGKFTAIADKVLASVGAVFYVNTQRKSGENGAKNYRLSNQAMQSVKRRSKMYAVWESCRYEENWNNFLQSKADAKKAKKLSSKEHKLAVLQEGKKLADELNFKKLWDWRFELIGRRNKSSTCLGPLHIPAEMNNGTVGIAISDADVLKVSGDYYRTLFGVDKKHSKD
jgi:hypothetical protein